MSEKYSDSKFLEKQFIHLKEGADFYRMGPLLFQIMNNRAEVDISDSDLKDAFDMTVKYRLKDEKLDEALQYYVWSFSVDGIEENKRLEYTNLLYDFIEKNEEQLIRKDFEQILKHLKQQIKYLELYSENKAVISELKNLEEKVIFKQKFSADREEGPLQEYIEELTNLYYKNLPDEEAADYAAQIIIGSAKL